MATVSRAVALIGNIILETPPSSVEDVQDIDTASHLARLLQIAEAAKRINREDLKWIMPTDTGIRWQTQDGKVHTKDLW